MSNSSTNEMVLVYDLRQDENKRKRLSSTFKRHWRAFERGKLRAKIAEGRITKLFFAPYDGEHYFEIDDGKRRQSWIRRGDASLYAIGRHARVEYLIFRRWFFWGTVSAIPVASKIWIGDM
jgi:hypothetical protein